MKADNVNQGNSTRKEERSWARVVELAQQLDTGPDLDDQRQLIAEILEIVDVKIADMETNAAPQALSISIESQPAVSTQPHISSETVTSEVSVEKAPLNVRIETPQKTPGIHSKGEEPFDDFEETVFSLPERVDPQKQEPEAQKKHLTRREKRELKRKSKEMVIPTAPPRLDAETIAFGNSFEHVVGGVDAIMGESHPSERYGKHVVHTAEMQTGPIPRITDEMVSEKANEEQESSEPAQQEEIISDDKAINEALHAYQETRQKVIEQTKDETKEFARFKQLYASKDGGLFLYENAEGHIVALDSSKLA